MQITMKESEFKEAIVCWLKEQGFDPEMYDMDMKIIPGRIHGTSVIVDLESKGSSYLTPREFTGISKPAVYVKGLDATAVEPMYASAVDNSVTLATTSPATTTSTSLHFNSPSNEE